MKKLILVFGLLFSLNAFAQSIDPDDSFTFDIGLPNAFVNKPFKNIMQGLCSATATYQYATKSGLAFGVGGTYTYFAINEFRLPTRIYGGMHNVGVFIKIGYEKFWTERIGTDIGLKVGTVQSWTVSDTLKRSGIWANQNRALYIEPCVSFVITADVNSSFRLTFGYPLMGFNFTPQLVGESSTMGFDINELAKNCSFLTVGFGYTFYFNGKKSSSSGWDED